ncbi:MAG TPA: two-component regulator propeller domain-containing protein [Niastella sp.]
MKYIGIYTLFFMFIFCIFCKGQNKTELPKDDIKSETNNVITFHGPNSITRTIIQDRKGNIWIAAFDGIFRYDGKSFTNITSKVSSARFISVLEDRKGNFWFSSVGSGVYHYDGKSFLNFTTMDGLASDRVTCSYEDKTGNIWFGTEGGASCYDGKSFRNLLMYNDVNSIIEDKTGKFWFGTRGNACFYDGKTFTDLTHNGKPFPNVRTIIEDKKGNIWLGGADGLWRYDGTTFTNFTKKFVGYIIEDKKGNIWASSESDNGEGWALSRYDEKSLFNKKTTVTETNLSSKNIFSIFEDYDGNIWFGSSGVYRYDGFTFDDFKGTSKYPLHFFTRP